MRLNLFDLIFFSFVTGGIFLAGWLIPEDVGDKIQVELVLGIPATMSVYFAKSPQWKINDIFPFWSTMFVAGIFVLIAGVIIDPFWWSVGAALASWDLVKVQNVLSDNQGGFVAFIGFDGIYVGLVGMVRLCILGLLGIKE